MDWAAGQTIPTHYPNGKVVRYHKLVKATLRELAQWCNENCGFEPTPILHDFTNKRGEAKTGILNALGFDVNVYRHCLSALGRLGFISTKRRGNQNRATQYILHVNMLQTEYQDRLPDPAFRTESVEDESPHMSIGHVPESPHMSIGHVPIGHVPIGHVPEDLTLYRHVHEDDMSVEDSAPMSMSAEADGGGASSFCSNFLIPSLEDAGLHGFTPASLSFIDLAASDFTQTHGRPPERAVADHIAKRLVGFIRDKGIDVSSEAHRVFGYLRSEQIVPLVAVEDAVTLSFGSPQPSSEQPEAPAPPPPEVTLDPEAEAIWARALDRVREKVARPAYETWLANTVGVAFEDGVFIVGVVNQFVAEMLELRMYAPIEGAVDECTDDELITVQFAVVAIPDRRIAT